MPPIDRLAPDGIPEAPQIQEYSGSLGDLNQHLTHPAAADVCAAHDFFKPPVGTCDALLPNMSSSAQGLEVSLTQPSQLSPGPDLASALGSPPGLELSSLSPMGLESSALGGLGMPPGLGGGEALSPLVQLILKIPGHIGLASSFFEAIFNFFAPGQDMLGFLDPGLIPDGGGLADGLELDAGGGSEHVGLDMNLLPDDAPILASSESLLSFNGPSLTFDKSLSNSELFSRSIPGLDANFDHSHEFSNSLNTGGLLNTPGKPIFEAAPDQNVYYQGGQEYHTNGNVITADPGSAFNSTIGGTPDPSPTLNQNAAPSGSGDTTALEQGGSETHGRQAQSNDATAADGTDKNTGDSAPETTPYTVVKGDNLWDIARKHLGDGTRWHEVYELNKTVVGDNPRLIFPGQNLALPKS
jgi:LysM repeat protein